MNKHSRDARGRGSIRPGERVANSIPLGPNRACRHIHDAAGSAQMIQFPIATVSARASCLARVDASQSHTRPLKFTALARDDPNPASCSDGTRLCRIDIAYTHGYSLDSMWYVVSYLMCTPNPCGRANRPPRWQRQRLGSTTSTLCSEVALQVGVELPPRGR